jgi:hypothetical protein
MMFLSYALPYFNQRNKKPPEFRRFALDYALFTDRDHRSGLPCGISQRKRRIIITGAVLMLLSVGSLLPPVKQASVTIRAKHSGWPGSCGVVSTILRKVRAPQGTVLANGQTG